jgi:glycogen phosphorylase
VKKIEKFTVRPNIPKSLQPILDIAYNLWWTWNTEAIDLFRWVDNELWESANHNPIKMLGQVSPERFEQLEKDESFLRHMNSVSDKLKTYLEHETWFDRNYKDKFNGSITYFSFEFGLHESLSLYSGGLGVLSGDHLKSSSELGIPLVGVGLIYRYGYFKQYLNIDGWQQEEFVENDFENMPMTLMRKKDGSPIMISLELPGRVVYAQIWKIQVGRVSLYLLDADLDMNDPADREITYKLYGGDLHTRIQQEMLLGIGGLRALEALGIETQVWHMNEGHAAFMVFEKTRLFMEKYNISFEAARDMVSSGSLFTTHTPVPAGIDLFPPDMIESYFSNYARAFGISMDDLLSFGRQNQDNPNEFFSMPILAFNFSDRSNGVSELHGKVSRLMWRSLWPGLPDKLIPLRHITNGIHTATWLSEEIARLYDRYLGPQMLDNPLDFSLWEKVDNIPDMELWRSKDRLRENLVSFARKRVKIQTKRRGAVRQKNLNADEILDPRALTIGFARRFATYKRATLIFKDPERLARILNDRDRPVQIVFAGKSHPKDNNGKEFIRAIVHMASLPEFRRKIVFLEDYNMDIARHLVQGVDIWLNTPRRPQEASGTSGMKVCPNGGLNVSVLDGWWVEGYNGSNGWAIGGEVYSDPEVQDDIEALALYEILENEIVSMFYDRGVDGLPREWIKLMKNSMATVSPVFNTNRMVSQYFEDTYLPAFLQMKELGKNQMKTVAELEDWKDFVRANWHEVDIEAVYSEDEKALSVGMDLEVMAKIQLGNIKPKDVKVALFYGGIDVTDDISEGERIWMEPLKDKKNGSYTFKGRIPLASSGRKGFSVCIYPDTHKMSRRFEKAYIKWWQG